MPTQQYDSQHARHFYSPVSTTPCPPGWKAVFEVMDAEEQVVGIESENVVMWAVMEYRIDVMDETETHILSSDRQENFVCGLIVDSETEGGLRPALTCEGLIGYQAPNETFEEFAEKIGFDAEAVDSEGLIPGLKPTDELH